MATTADQAVATTPMPWFIPPPHTPGEYYIIKGGCITNLVMPIYSAPNWTDPTYKAISCTDQLFGDFVNYMSDWYVHRYKFSKHMTVLLSIGFLIIVSSFCVSKRKFLAKNFWGGRPSLPIFGDLLLTKEARVGYILLHCAMAEIIMYILFSLQWLQMPYFGEDVNWYNVQTEMFAGGIIFRISAICIYFLLYAPLFIALSQATVWHLFLTVVWLVYYLVQLIQDLALIAPWFEPRYNHPEYQMKHLPLTLFCTKLPTVIAKTVLLIYVTILLYRTFMQAIKQHHLNWFQKILEFNLREQPIEQLFDAKVRPGGKNDGASIDHNAYQNEFKKSCFYKEVDAVLNPTRHEKYNDKFIWKFMGFLGYTNQYGYRYPVKLLAGLTVSAILMYQFILFFVFDFLLDFKQLLDSRPDMVELGEFITDTARISGLDQTIPFLADSERVLRYLNDIIVILFISLIIAFVFSFLNTLLGLLLHMKTFRRHSKQVRRGYRHEANIQKISNFSSISAGIKYGAYICTYPALGAFFQFLLIFLVLFIVLTAVILPLIIDGEESWIVNMFKSSWPGWTYTIIVIVIQLIFSRFVFNADSSIMNKQNLNRKNADGTAIPPDANTNGHILIKYRKLFDIFSLFFWFNYVFLGIISLLLRVIFTVLVSILFIGRLDQSSVQRNFETLDPGFNVYLGFQAFEEGNTHPVLLTALNFFLSGPAGARYRTRMKFGEDSEIYQRTLKAKKPMENRKFRAKWRWHFAYTMIRNPKVLQMRLDKIREEEQKKTESESVKIPVIDPQTVEKYDNDAYYMNENNFNNNQSEKYQI